MCYEAVCEERRKSFEETVRRYLTCRKPTERPRRPRLGSSDEDSTTIDPSDEFYHFTAIGAERFVRRFRERSLSQIVVNYQTRTTCPAAIHLIARQGTGPSAVYFPRMQAAKNFSTWCDVEEIIQNMCYLCQVPFKIIDNPELTSQLLTD